MSKKWLALVLMSTLSLGGCGIIDQLTAGESEAAMEEAVEDIENVSKESSTGEVTQENGPFKVTLKDAKITQMPPEESIARDLVILSVFVEVTNESEDFNTIHPNQAVILTDTGQEVIADKALSDKVGGDFAGNETKQGEIHFIFSGEIDDVSSIQCMIDTGYDSEYNWLGENLEFVVDF